MPAVVNEPPKAVVPPYAPLPKLPPELVRAIEEVALRANDRYLYEFIEEYSFCPFAKGGREAGQTTRFVFYADTPSVEPLLELMHTVANDLRIVVAQVIMPLVEVTGEDFIEFCDQLTALGHARLGGRSVLAYAALHPGLRYNDRNPFAMVPLFRRAPDPTIQWVRLSSLEELYEGRDTEVRFVDPSDIEAFLKSAPPPRPPLYNRVAETNAKMARRVGLPRVEAMLAEYSAEAQRAYARIILGHTGALPSEAAEAPAT